MLSRPGFAPDFKLAIVVPRWFGQRVLAAAGPLLLAILSAPHAFAALGELELRVVDRQTAKPVTVRMHVWNAKGIPRKVRGQPAFDDHFVFHGRVILRLPPGEYRFRIQRGCEYREQSGNFLIRSAARDNKTLEMERFVSMRDQGWLSADLFVLRPASQYPLWAASEDLDLLLPVDEPAPPPSGDSKRRTNAEATILPAPIWDGERHQLAVCHVELEPKPEVLSNDLSSSGRLLKLARGDAGAVCVATDIRASDLPMWVASQRLDAVVIMRPADKSPSQSNELVSPDGSRFPGTRGLARFREHVYYQLLETGIQMTPLACSRSGDAPVPVGSMRTYAWKGSSTDDSAEAWWQAVRNGHVILTGGPVLIARANNRLPGWVFAPTRDSRFQLEFSATLYTRQKISYLEIIKNGVVEHTVPLNDWVAANGKLPTVRFDDSGWAMLRAVIDAEDDYRYAMSGPFYVQVEEKPRISRAAVRFFLDWATRRRDELQPQAIGGGLAFHDAAVRFWMDRESEANAD